jgi:oligopeptide/dipeptide ABC transporter ATP-binding protein
VPGNLPDLRRTDLPACRFAERCERRTERCGAERPVLDAQAAHAVACWHPLDGVLPVPAAPTETAHV